MASLYKRGANYYGQWYNARRTPRRIRLSLRTRSRKDAKRLLVSLDSAYIRGRWDPWVQTVDECHGRSQAPKRFSDAAVEFLREKKSLVSASTLTSYESVLSLFGRELSSESVKLEALTSSEVSCVIYGYEVAESTRKQRYRILRVYFNWCLKRGYLKTSPLYPVPIPRPQEARTRVVRWDDLTKICDAISIDYAIKIELARGHCAKGDLLWLIPLFKFAYLSGMRISELGRLRWEDINSELRTLWIPKQKSRKQSSIAISEAAQDVLKNITHRSECPFVFASPRFRKASRSTHAFCRRASKSFSYYRKKAGIVEPLTFHGLRHGFCTALAESGISAHVIRLAARHSSVSTSQRYVDVSQDIVRSALDLSFQNNKTGPAK